MKNILSILIFNILFFSNSALAGLASEEGKITSLSISGGGWVSIYLDGTDSTTVCSGGARWTMHSSDPLFDVKYSTVLAAAASGKTITLRHNSTDCGLYNGNIVEMVHITY